MGKKFCYVGDKWCRYLKKEVCNFNKTNLTDLNECPRIESIRTKTLFDLLHEVNFEDVFVELIRWFPHQETNREGYKEVFKTLLEKTTRKHELGDFFIEVKRVKDGENNKDYLNVSGVNKDQEYPKYSLEFHPWEDWITLFITKNTLEELSKEVIVAACLYEMTFHGFTEEKVMEAGEELRKSIEEIE